MIYIANGALSAGTEAWEAVYAVTGIQMPRFFESSRYHRGTIDEFGKALKIWDTNHETHQAVVDALGLKLYWLIEHNVPTTQANFLGGGADERYYQAVCNALADIVRDTKIIYQWRQYKLDWHQYRLSKREKGIEIRASDFFRWGVNPDEARLNWERRMLENAHPATREALAWRKAASALQQLVDSQKKRKDPTVREYPEIDLPEFELAPSWVYLSAAK